MLLAKFRQFKANSSSPPNSSIAKIIVKLQICDRFILTVHETNIGPPSHFSSSEPSLRCSKTTYWRSKHKLSVPFWSCFYFACFNAQMIATAIFTYKPIEILSTLDVWFGHCPIYKCQIVCQSQGRSIHLGHIYL
jgi:hypothetical protein